MQHSSLMPSFTPAAAALGTLQVRAKAVVVNADPFRLRELVGAQHFGPQLNSRLDGMRKDGTTLKVRGLHTGKPWRRRL